MNTDLIVIGSGPGGYHTAGYAAKHGLSVVVVEEGHAGGTCLNCGCIPTKVLCHEAETIETVSGYIGSRPEIDFRKISERKQQVVEQLRSSVENLMAAPGITFIRGHAMFKDAHTITVDGEEYTAANIIIATGSRVKMPPIEGCDAAGVVTSTELLGVKEIPWRLCIIGAGVIGMEFASVFRSFGSEVTVVEFLKECLSSFDSDIAKRLRKLLEKRGIKFCMQSAVSSITHGEDGLTVSFEQKKKPVRVQADVVLTATGREPRTDNLGLETTDIVFDSKGISVDDNMQTNVNGIYAVGDVNGRTMLAHAASAQGMTAVDHIVGKGGRIRLDIIPAAVFTSPEAAAVGLTEDFCKERGMNHVVRESFYRANGKALAMNAGEGLLKLITDAGGRIIGCHAYGIHASDIIQEAAAVMNFDGTVDDLRHIIHNHPTLEEILLSAAGQAV